MIEHIKTELNDGVLAITFARPDKKNALTDEMYGALADALETAETDPNTRVVLLLGEGDLFTAGNDIGGFAAAASGPLENLGKVERFFRALATSSRPIVAAVQGRAMGVGTTLLLHCDLILLAENALLSTPFVNLALVPEAASSLLLPARIGHVRAFEMFALGKAINAHAAVAMGLANRVVPLENLHAEARNLAGQLSRQPAGALSATKKLMRDSEALTARLTIENAAFAMRLQSAEAREAFSAFAERRAPDFSTLNN